MLYHDFDKFKREATQLKKLFREANPNCNFSLTQCQNWIAQSIPAMQNFNTLYLAHQAQKERIRNDLQPHFAWSSASPQLDEWFEFATFPAQLDWINGRHERLLHALLSENICADRGSVDATLKSLWVNHISTPRLTNTLASSKEASIAMFSEKEWRNGILLGGKSDQKYMRFLSGCLPKLSRDGGILTLSAAQARSFYKMWKAAGEHRVPLRVFDLDRERASLHDKELQAHTCWPEYRFTPGQYDADTLALRYFQESALSPIFLTDREHMWLDGSRTFWHIHMDLCSDRHNRAIKPDVQTLMNRALDEQVPYLVRARLSTYLAHLGVTTINAAQSNTKIREVSVEQHNYVCPLTLVWSQTFTEPRQVASRLTLSEWAAAPGLSIFILPEPERIQNAIASTMILGMLSVLCAHQIKQALTGTIQSLSKGLWVPPSHAVAERLPKAMRQPPSQLRHHTLWGWARLANDTDFSFSDDAIHTPQSADEGTGVAVWLGRPHGTPWSRGLALFYRLFANSGRPEMYCPWQEAISMDLKTGS